MNLPPLRDDTSTRAGSVADRSRVSSVAEQIHSSYTRASLLRQAEEKKARKVRFYRNGDKFYRGAVYAVSPERFRTFDSLLAELTRSPICDPKLMPNGVRYVFSLDGSRKILSLEELQEGESYVCATLDIFKDIDYTKNLDLTAWHQSSRAARPEVASAQLQQQPTPQQYDLPLLTGAPRRHTPPAAGSASVVAGLVSDGDVAGALAADEAAFVECIKPRLITVVRSGPRPRMAVRIPLNKRTARSLEQVLRGVSDIIRLDSGSVRRMYALSGRQVHCLADFFLEDTVFLACGNERPCSEDFYLDTNEVRLVCAYRFSASQKAERVTLRSQSSVRIRPPHIVDITATDQRSLQMRSQPTSPMVARKQPRISGTDVRPRLAEEHTDATMLKQRRQQSFQGSENVLQAMKSAVSSSNNTSRGSQPTHMAPALAPAATTAATDLTAGPAAATAANDGLQTGYDEARMGREQKHELIMGSSEATDSERRYYYDNKGDNLNDFRDDAVTGNSSPPEAGSQMSYAAADASSTATARTDEGGESLPLDDDEPEANSGGEEFFEPSAGSSIASRTASVSDRGLRSEDIHADNEGSAVGQTSGRQENDSEKARLDDDQSFEKMHRQPKPPVHPQPQRHQQLPLANGHAVRDVRLEAGEEPNAAGGSTLVATHGGTVSLGGDSSLLSNASSKPLGVVTPQTVVKSLEAASSIASEPLKGDHLLSHQMLPNIQGVAMNDRMPTEAENASAGESQSAADSELGRQDSALTATAAALPANAAAADHRADDPTPVSAITVAVDVQTALEQTKINVVPDGAAADHREMGVFTKGIEDTATDANNPVDDLTSDDAEVVVNKGPEVPLATKIVAAVALVTDQSLDEREHYTTAETHENDSEVAVGHLEIESAPSKASDSQQIPLPAKTAVTESEDYSVVEVSSAVNGLDVSEGREHETIAEIAVSALGQPTGNLDGEKFHYVDVGAPQLAETLGNASEITLFKNTAVPDVLTSAETARAQLEKPELESAALLDDNSNEKREVGGSSTPEHAVFRRNADVASTDTDSPAARKNPDGDAELPGSRDDAQKEEGNESEEGDKDGDALVLRSYKVLRTIAEDGAVKIKECVARDTGRTLALKVVSKLASTPEELRSIAMEARLLRDVNHVNIIGLVDNFETSKAWYFVTDLDEGSDIASTIMTAATYSEADAASLFSDLLSALKYLHSRNIVHGNVCMDKLLVVASPVKSADEASISTGRRLKLGGFSCARLASQTTPGSEAAETTSFDGVHRGSPVGDGTQCGASSITDLVAAGEVLWTLLTGRAIPVEGRLGHVDILEETSKLGVSLEATSLLIALLDARTMSGIRSADEALSHSWFTLATATPDEVSSKYFEDRKAAIAINARVSFKHKRKYSTKATAISILKSSACSDDVEVLPEETLRGSAQEITNLTENNASDQSVSIATMEGDVPTAFTPNPSLLAVTQSGSALQPALTLPNANSETNLSESPSWKSAEARDDKAVDSEGKGGAVDSSNGFSTANRLKASTAREEELVTMLPPDGVQQIINGKADGQADNVPNDAIAQRRSEESRPAAEIFGGDEYF